MESQDTTPDSIIYLTYLDSKAIACYIEVLASQWVHQIVPLSTGQVIPLSFSFDK